MTEILPIKWQDDRIKVIDQTRLPGEEVYIELGRYQDVASAVLELKIRGAPAIGIGIAYAAVLGALEIDAEDKEAFLERLEGIGRSLAATRPTAVNLKWAITRMLQTARAGGNVPETKQALITEAIRIHDEQIEADKNLSEFGAGLIADGATVLTHCNTGALATSGYGTALGVIKQAFAQGKRIEVIATETRPLLQGARLTAWELKRADIPFHLITDSMAGHLLKQGGIGCVIVGADRIAANGDTANKIGTYALAVLSLEHGVPFYVAAPTTTIDMAIDSGRDIPIEERSPEEITRIRGVDIAPADTAVYNPAFDVTPHHYITAIITERGIIREPYVEKIRDIFGQQEAI